MKLGSLGVSFSVFFVADLVDLVDLVDFFSDELSRSRDGSLWSSMFTVFVISYKQV
jgi:hypothetical protein